MEEAAEGESRSNNHERMIEIVDREGAQQRAVTVGPGPRSWRQATRPRFAVPPRQRACKG